MGNLLHHNLSLPYPCPGYDGYGGYGGGHGGGGGYGGHGGYGKAYGGGSKSYGGGAKSYGGHNKYQGGYNDKAGYKGHKGYFGDQGYKGNSYGNSGKAGNNVSACWGGGYCGISGGDEASCFALFPSLLSLFLFFPLKILLSFFFFFLPLLPSFTLSTFFPYTYLSYLLPPAVFPFLILSPAILSSFTPSAFIIPFSPVPLS